MAAEVVDVEAVEVAAEVVVVVVEVAAKVVALNSVKIKL